MPLVDHSEHILRNCKEAHPDYNPTQIIDETQRYVSDIMVPVMPEREIIEQIQEQPKKNVKNPRPISHYGDSERRSRKIKSAQLRRAIIQHTYFTTTGMKEYTEKGNTFDRSLQRLFKDIPENATKAQKEAILKYNKEIDLLFANNPKRTENENKLCEKIMADAPGTTKEEAINEIRIRRGQIIMQAIHEASFYTEKASKMIDENLPANELVENYKKACWAMNILTEVRAIASSVGTANPYYILSDEEKEFAFEQDRLLSDVSTAINKASMIANPMYEYIDINALSDYELDRATADTDDVYLDEFTSNTEWGEQRKEKDPEFYDTIANGVKDSYIQLMADAFFYEQNKYAREIENAAHDNGLASSDSLLYYETDPRTNEQKSEKARADSTATDRLKFSNEPAVIAKYDRMVVVQNIKGTIRQVEPETIFNHKFRDYTNALTQQRAHNDPWYHTSSDVFKTMRRAFEATERLGQLQSGADLDIAFNKYNDLLNKTNAYLATKVNHDRKKWTLRHIDMANQFKKFAEIKLEQLNIVRNSRLTKEQFAGKTPEQKKAITEEFNRVSAQKDKAKLFETAPEKWFTERFDTLSKQVQPSEGMKRIISVFKSEIDSICKSTRGDALYENQPIFLQPKLGSMLGAMTLLELFKLDRKTRKSLLGGKLEKVLENPTEKDLVHISELYANKITGKNYATNRDKLIENNHGDDYYDRITPAQFKEFVINYDPKAVAEELAETVYAEYGLSFTESRLEGKLLNSIKPLRDSTFNEFERELRNTVKTKILEPLSELSKNNAEPLSADKTNELLLNAVLCSVILRERQNEGNKGPGYCERKMTENLDNIADFRAMIAGMPEFDELQARFVDENGCLKIDNLSSLADENFAGDIVDAITQTERALDAKEVEDLLIERFPTQIEPIRGKENDAYEKKLSELAEIGIIKALKDSTDYAEKHNIDTINAKASALILENIIIYELVSAERKDTGADHAGYFESTLSDDNDLKVLRKEIAAAKEFKKLMADYANPNGEIDIKAISDIINDNATREITQSLLAISDAHEMRERTEAAAALEKRIKIRYTDGITPRRGEEPDASEQGLVNFAKEEILDKIKEFIASDSENKRFIDAKTAKNIIGSCMVSMMAQNERETNALQGIDEIGKIEKTFGEDKNAVYALRDRICKTEAFADLTKEYLAPDGKMSLQELSRFIENRVPQKSVAAIRTEFAIEENSKQAKNARKTRAKTSVKQADNGNPKNKPGGVIPG